MPVWFDFYLKVCLHNTWDVNYEPLARVKQLRLSVTLILGPRTSKSSDCLPGLLQLHSVLKTWVLLNQPSSSQNVFFFSPLEGSQVTVVQATLWWYQCDWL